MPAPAILYHIKPGFIKVTSRNRIIVYVKDQLLALHADLRPFADRACDKRIASDDNALLDHGVTPENGCAGVDGHMVFYRRMPLFAAQILETGKNAGRASQAVL